MGLWSRLFECASCEAEKARNRELEARLFAEIDSNRLRESELLASVLRVAGVQTLPGARTELAPRAASRQKIDEDPEEYDEVLEQQIQEVAQQMIAAGRAIGNEYTEDAQLLLLAKIRENPDHYLS